MATAAATVDTADDQRPDDQHDQQNMKRRNRPPNRRRHEDQVEELMVQIRPLEEKFKSLGRPQLTDTSGKSNGILEQLNSELKRLREEKDAAITKRKAMDQELRVANDKISKMSDSLSKLEAGLKFKTQSAIDDAIRKLDHQLQTRHFKYTEENRIVREIDSLRRSKKRVKEYQERRKEMEEERMKKGKLKAERDKYFFMVSTLKKKEDSVKQQIQQLRSKETEAWNRYKTSGPERENIKKEIDGLYEQKRQLIAEYRLQQNEYHEQLKLYRAETARRREEEKKAMTEAKQKAWDAYEASLEPYEDERHICSALIKYLQKFQAEQLEGPSPGVSPGVSPIPSPSCPNPPSSLMEGKKEFTVLKKKDEDEVFLHQSAVIKRRRSGRRSRKASWLNKPMRHSAQIFSQFASLGISAPSTPAELPDVLQQLYAKRKQYKEFSESVMASDFAHHHRRHLSGSSSLSTTSSQATSDIDSSQFSTITSVDSTDDTSSPNSSEPRTQFKEEKGASSSVHDCDGDTEDEQEQSKNKSQDKSVPKLNTKLSALKISAAQSLQVEKNSEQTPPQSESQNELALPSHGLEPETTGDGGSSSSATESTLPETPLSDMSAPFDNNSGDGLDSGIDETRGGRSEKGILNEEDELSDKEELIDNNTSDGDKLADMNANNPIIGSTSPTQEGTNYTHNAKQDTLSCNMDSGGVPDDTTGGIHLNEESESFHESVCQREHSSQEVTL